MVIDDEQSAINVIKKYIGLLPDLKLIGTETNPVLGLDIIKKEKPDVVFLDIEMPKMSGLEVMKTIGKETQVVFCTAYSEFAVKSYDLEATDYLMKPVEFDRFLKAIKRVNDKLLHQSSANADIIAGDYIFVKAGQRGKMLKIDLDDIDFVEARNNYVAFHCLPRKILAYLPLKELQAKFPDKQFMRVHKSYIVALKQISSIENNELVLKRTPERIPLGAVYKDAFLEKMRNRLIS